MGWNHNIHYHPFVLHQVPAQCRRALDVGSGRGALARKLGTLSQEVIGIDVDGHCLVPALSAARESANITFLEGDILTAPLRVGGFDFLAAIATLHHLPLRPALLRFRELLAPGGVLAVVGLYRNATPIDYAWAMAALPISAAIRRWQGEEEVGAPLRDPTETLATIRKECAELLPGAVIQRRLFFRYTLAWQKPRA